MSFLLAKQRYSKVQERSKEPNSDLWLKKRLRNRWRSRIVTVQQIDKRNKRGNSVVFYLFVKMCTQVYRNRIKMGNIQTAIVDATEKVENILFFFCLTPLLSLDGSISVTLWQNKILNESVGRRRFYSTAKLDRIFSCNLQISFDMVNFIFRSSFNLRFL